MAFGGGQSRPIKNPKSKIKNLGNLPHRNNRYDHPPHRRSPRPRLGVTTRPHRPPRRLGQGPPARQGTRKSPRKRRHDLLGPRTRTQSRRGGGGRKERRHRLRLLPRSLRRHPPPRHRRIHGRLRHRRLPLLRFQNRRRSLLLLLRQMLQPQNPRLPFLQRLRPLRQRPRPHGTRHPPLRPENRQQPTHHRLRPRQNARLHLHRRLHRRHHRRPRPTPHLPPNKARRLRRR